MEKKSAGRASFHRIISEHHRQILSGEMWQRKIGGFDTDYTYILDYDFFVSLACEGDVYIIHEPLNFFRVRKGSNTGEVMGATKEKQKYM